MKKINKFMGIVTVLVLIFITGCSADQKKEDVTEPIEVGKEEGKGVKHTEINLGDYTPEKPLVVNLAHGDQNLDPYISNKHSVALMFKNYVENYSGGKIVVDIQAGTSGGERQIVEQTQMGIVDIAVMSDGPLTGFFNPIEVIHIPYLFSNDVVADEVLDGEFGRELTEGMRKETGLRTLSITLNAGFRHMVNSKRPIKTPEDLKGLKMRTVESQAQMKIMELLGASPTPVSWAETYSALQTGVVDGLNNNAQGILLGNLQEVQKYITLDGHTYSPGFLITNDDWFSDLPSGIKNILEQGAIYSKDASRVVVRMAEATGNEKLSKEFDMEIYKISAEEKDLFKEKSQQPYIDWLSESVDQNWIDKVLKAVEEAEKKIQYYE